MDEEKQEHEHHQNSNSEHGHEHHHHHHSSGEHSHSHHHSSSSSGEHSYHHHSSSSSGEHSHHHHSSSSSGEHSHHHHSSSSGEHSHSHHHSSHHSSGSASGENRSERIDKYEAIHTEDKKKSKNAKKKKKKTSAGVKALIAVVLVLLIIIVGFVIFINVYLSKINYDNGKAPVNPVEAVDDLPDFNERKQADSDIADNLSDDVLWYDSKVYNIVLAGVDYGDEGTGHYPRSDSMILLSINSYKNIINMVSLSRAAYVAIPEYMNTRLNMAHYFGGPKLMVETIQRNYKVRIDNYITVNFVGFEKLIDSIGGVTINMTEAEAGKILNKSKAGSYQLDGKTALLYARERHLDSDRGRTGRQRKLLNAISDKFRNASFGTMTDMLDTILPLVTTNMTKAEIIGQIAKVPQYLAMPVKEDIIPHNPLELTLKGDFDVLLINWQESNAYLHRLLYPDITPESHQ